MGRTYDLIAVNERGVYAICSDECSRKEKDKFIRDALKRIGNRVERVTTEEAVSRHRAYLASLPEFAGLLAPSPPSSTTLSEGGV
jgi:hypothetical protein